MVKRMGMLGLLWCLPVMVAGCQSAASHRAAVTAMDKGRISVGNVQREIRVGMTSSQVIEVLGAPNMVTTDEERREVWVYDKIATERVYSGDSGGAFLLLGMVSGERGASSTSQRTLTIIIKFDKDHRVRDFAYRSSSF